MNREELDAFLARTAPALLGVVGTLEEDGAPHVVPVWYRHDGDHVHIWTGERRRWARNVARDPRVAFSVQEPWPPYAAVVIQGRAELVTGGGEEISEEIRRITERYIEPDAVEEYISGWAHLRTVVTLRPDRISSWSRGY